MNKSIKTLALLAIGRLIVGANVPAAYAGEHAEGSHRSASKESCKGKDGCKAEESCKHAEEKAAH